MQKKVSLTFFLLVVNLAIIFFTRQLPAGLFTTLSFVSANLVLGIICVISLRMDSRSAQSNESMALMILSKTTLLLAVIAGFFIFSVSLWLTKTEWMPLTAALSSFLLPSVVYDAYHSFIRMPGIQMVAWKTGLPVINSGKKLRKDISVNFDLRALNEQFNDDKPLRVAASQYEITGNLFEEWVNTQDNSAETKSDIKFINRQTEGLLFAVRDVFLGTRWLDPYLSLHENRVGNEAVISVHIFKTPLL